MMRSSWMTFAIDRRSPIQAYSSVAYKLHLVMDGQPPVQSVECRSAHQVRINGKPSQLSRLPERRVGESQGSGSLSERFLGGERSRTISPSSAKCGGGPGGNVEVRQESPAESGESLSNALQEGQSPTGQPDPSLGRHGVPADDRIEVPRFLG